MKLLIGIIIALFAAVGIALLLRQDPGYVLISIGQWTIETSFAVLIFALVVSFVLLYYLIRYTMHLWQMPAQLKAANRQRILRKARRLFIKGMKDLAEGRWAAAEATLTKSVENSESPVLNYIGAARAAQQLNADWRRDNYLRKAQELSEHNALIVGLTKAELLLEDQHPAKAKDVLLHLRPLYPRNTRLLELLAQSYRELGEWTSLNELLPEIRKHTALDESQYGELQVQVYKELLADTAQNGTLEELRALWKKKIPKQLRLDESLLIAYAGHLGDYDAADEAEALLRTALNRQWSEKLIVGYGELGRGNAPTQLSTAEEWLKEHDKDPYLLLTLGRLAKRSQQLDKARNYLEQSLMIMPNPDVYHELGEVLEQMGDQERANYCYRTGMRLMSGRPEEKEGVALLPPAEPKASLPGTELSLRKEDQKTLPEAAP